MNRVIIAPTLGSGTYILALDTSKDGGVEGIFYYKNSRLPNSLVWSGATGVLPGAANSYCVNCYVFWG